MKNKIKKFSKGDFRTVHPEIVLPVTNLEMTIGEGESCQGSFILKNRKEGDIRGLVYSSSFRIHLEEQGFEGNPVELRFTYDGSGLAPGHVEQPITPAGSPAIVASAAKDAIAPPGIPGVPTDRSTFARRIIIIIDTLTLTPHAFAKNMIMNDITIETASILTVAPSGIAILEIWLETPSSFSTQLLLIGMVAELEQVPNAFSPSGFRHLLFTLSIFSALNFHL